jgi:polar amino acid transport system permease protein
MSIDWGVVQYSIPLLAEGLMATMKISLIAIVFGTALGVLLGLAAVTPIAQVRWCVRAYVDFIRGTPLLIQIFLVYFALPVIGIDMSEFWSGVTALSLNAGGFIAEIVRAGLSAIPKGQTEAAMALGLRPTQTLLLVLLPQIVRPALPPVTNELISLIKGSSLLSVISVYELTRAGQAIISERFVPLEIYALIALYYYAAISALAFLSRWLERRLLPS